MPVSGHVGRSRWQSRRAKRVAVCITVLAAIALSAAGAQAATIGTLTYGGCFSNDGSGGSGADAPGAPLDRTASVAVSPNSRSVYVTSVGSDTITHFFAKPQGQLTYGGCVSNDGSGGLRADAPGSPLTDVSSVA